jgi:hypothetical protein
MSFFLAGVATGVVRILYRARKIVNHTEKQAIFGE